MKLLPIVALTAFLGSVAHLRAVGVEPASQSHGIVDFTGPIVDHWFPARAFEIFQLD